MLKGVVNIFSKRIMKELRYYGFEDKIIEIKTIIEKHDQYYCSMMKPLPKRPQLLLGQNGFHFLQTSLFRSRKLMEGFVLSLNMNNPLVAVLTTRAHFEVTGAVAYFYKKLDSFYKGNIEYERVNEVLQKLTLGVKSKGNLMHAPDPVNVMSLIDAADELFQKMSKSNEKIFRAAYDDLSEICHPNSFGSILSADVNSDGLVKYKNKDEILTIKWFHIHDFSITISSFMYFYENARRLIEANEEIPIIL